MAGTSESGGRPDPDLFRRPNPAGALVSCRFHPLCGCPLTLQALKAGRAFPGMSPSVRGELGEGGGKVAFIDAAETGEMAGAVDKQLVPDPAGVAIDHAVL